jgi:hypothetical protein
MLRSVPSRRLAASFALSVFVAIVSAPICLGAEDRVGADAVSKERLQAMLTAGDDGMIVATFKRHPNATLPFIDSYLEGGLALIEKGAAKEGEQPTADAVQSYRMGIRFAKLADQAFGGTDFTDYANAFASWSPSEQKAFREGQKLFREGMKMAKDDPAKATQTLERSLGLADGLDDTWGQAMAQGALATLYLAQAEAKGGLGGGDAAEVLLTKADQASRAAVTLNRKVRLDEDRVNALLTTAKVIKAMGGKPDARSTPLQEAWSLVRSDAAMSAELRKAVGEALMATFEELKRPDAVEEIRRELAPATAETPK